MVAPVLHRLAIASACSLLLGTSGCVGLVRNTARSYDVAANGLAETDHAFRRALTAGNYADAVRRAGRVKDGAPQDELLRALYRGTAAFHAGDYLVAAQAFAQADALAERRETRSVSRHAASLITNDQVLSYLPSRTERLFTRYYAMMSYLRADSLASATVEARRLGLMLQATDDSLGDRERAVHALLRDAAGTVFEAAGETNDALVSYRNAAKLRGATPQEIDSITLDSSHPDSATVVVFVEAGFVAHRVSQEISFALGGNYRNEVLTNEARPRGPFVSNAAVDSVKPADVTTPWDGGKEVSPWKLITGARRVTTSPDTTSRRAKAPTKGEVDTKVVVAALVESVDGSDDGLFIGNDHNWRRRRNMNLGGVGFGGPMLSLSWPMLVRTDLPHGPVQVMVRDVAPALDAADAVVSHATVGSGSVSADVSDAIAADLRRGLPAMLTRLVIRSAAKLKIADAVEDEYGWWAGTLAGIAGDLLERADTRSWQLLPGRITMVRVRVPAGETAAKVSIGETFDAMTVRLPARTLAPGEIFVTNAHIFRAQSSLVP